MTSEPRVGDEAEIAALFARLRAEVARGPARTSSQPATRTDVGPSLGRDQAERAWVVTVDRPFLNKPGGWGRIRGLFLAPVKIMLRKLMRWYVEPAFGQQRDFNIAVLRTLDDLSRRIDDLADEVARAAGKSRETTAEPGGESADRPTQDG